MESGMGQCLPEIARPRGFVERLTEQESSLEERLKDARRMIELIESNPEMKELLELSARLSMRF
jgi:hypothetical protein